jgi:N-methylhydantoinase A
LRARRAAWFREAGDFVETPIYDRSELRHGDGVEGPAIIEQTDSTTVCPPGFRIYVDKLLNMVMTKTDLTKAAP